MMTKEEVFQFLKEHSKQYCQEKLFIKKFPEYYQDILSWNFLPDFKFSQKLYHYFNNDPDLKLGICPVCKNRCTFLSFGKGYSSTCSVSCGQLNEQTQNKIKETNIKKYGCENVFQSKIIKNKIKTTCKKKYKVENYSKTKECHTKMEETCLKKYGVKHYVQTNEFKNRYKQTCQEKYGVENYTKTNEYKTKSKQTCQEKYGVINYSQTKDWSHKKKKRILYDGIYFDSSWEVKVYQYCKENNIPCEYQPNITFEYLYNNETHQYHPDFLINGKLYEVKGNQFFDGDKMICPYNRNEYSDNWAETKHQCMIKNGIIILRKDDIKKLKERI